MPAGKESHAADPGNVAGSAKVAKNKRRAKKKGRLQPSAGAAGKAKATAGGGVRVRGLAALEEMLGGAPGLTPDPQAASSLPAKRAGPQVPPTYLAHMARGGASVSA